MAFQSRRSMKQSNVTSLLRQSSSSLSKINKIGKKSSTSSDKTVESSKLDDSILSNLDVGEKFKNRWRIHGTHLIKNVPERLNKPFTEDGKKNIKVAAFDLDGTMVDTKSGSKFPRSSNDWKWIDDKTHEETSVISKISELITSKHLIVIFTNQGGVLPEKTSKSYVNFTTRVNLIVQEISKIQPDFESHLLVFASPKRPGGKKLKYVPSSEEQHAMMRKPNTGMWSALTDYLINQGDLVIDKTASFFVGDAAGNPGDFSDSDKAFAENISIGRFLLPKNIFQ